MNKTDFMARIAKNIHDMKQLKINYKYLYDKSERQEIFKIARKISRYIPINVEESRNTINENKLYKNFLSSIEIFNSDLIYNYFNNHLNRLTLVRSKTVLDDDAELEYELKKKGNTKFYLNLPVTKLTITNQMGFAHEMGHIPEIDKPRHSFLEYSEAIPMFLEYISALECYGCNNAKDNFICERLSMTINDAASLTKLFKRCESKNEIQKVYFIQEFADTYKFLESFNYTLQLIDIFEEDKETVTKEIENIIKGKSLIDVSEDLSIDTDECKKLLKEYKRIYKEGY